ncbi:MAG: hypothetical protein JNL84_02440 [Candidatus Accumulibacter sp.]|nr:hypothetical protein [Accumulibacter sp.]
MVLLVSQSLTGGALLAALFTIPLFGRQVLTHCWRLIGRTRWLLLSLMLIFAWGGVGEPLWSGPFAPTRQGVDDALTHLGHLLLAFGGVAIMRATTTLGEMMTAVYQLSKPLRYLGIDPERGPIRLWLVLHYLAASPQPRDWRRLVSEPSSGTATTDFELSDIHLTRTDYLVIVMAVAGLMAFCYFI